MRHWENSTCLSFIERTTEKDYIYFHKGRCGLVKLFRLFVGLFFFFCFCLVCFVLFFVFAINSLRRHVKSIEIKAFRNLPSWSS